VRVNHRGAGSMPFRRAVASVRLNCLPLVLSGIGERRAIKFGGMAARTRRFKAVANLRKTLRSPKSEHFARLSSLTL